MKKPIVVGTGLVALDVIYRGNAQVPIRQCVGGTCGNVLTILSYLGWSAVPIARLAKDSARAVADADFARWGVDLRFVGLAPVGPTPIIVERIVQRDNQPVHRFSWTCPCCGAWLPRYKPVRASDVQCVTDAIPSASVFFVDRPSRAALDLSGLYAKAGALVVFEPSASSDPKLFERTIQMADIVKYSDQRLSAIPASPAKKRRLEIQTLGAAGLRYRSGGGRRVGTWHTLSSLAVGTVTDTAGAGDWCTAGLLSKLAKEGQVGFESCTESQIADALHYGQALSAWNCRFEGARGGMYERSITEFHEEVTALLRGAEATPLREATDISEAKPEQICPACDQTGIRAAKRASSSQPIAPAREGVRGLKRMQAT